MSPRPYEPGSRGKCPHCRVTVYFSSPTVISSSSSLYVGRPSGGETVYVYSAECPNCQKQIVTAEIVSEGKGHHRLVHPFNVVRTVPPEVPREIQEDFLEAAAVLPISEKASAALSRRCLQNLLADKGYKGKDLYKQIELALKDLPKRTADNLDAVRQIGNFAAHPMKHKSTGLIADVESEEASWNLDVLEELFEYYYVQPKRAEDKRKKLEEKLKTMGKPPLRKRKP